MSREISIQKKAEIVFELVEQLKKASQNLVKNYLWIGKILDKIHKDKLYVSYASHIENFDTFLQELNIKRSTAYHCMAVWREFGGRLTELDIPFRRLIKLLPVAKQNKDEWLEKAKTLTEADFNKEVLIAKGLNPDEECDENCPIVYFSYCPKHRRWVKLNAKPN